MNYILKIFTLIAISSFAGLTFADDAVAVVAPVAQKGDTAWMMMATILVILMSIPGLALFYGGMVRAKNMLSILMQVFVIFSLMAILWLRLGFRRTWARLAFSIHPPNLLWPLS